MYIILDGGNYMAFSMTGFGRGEYICETRRYQVEIRSVNSRFCDINIRMPRLFNFADSKIRKMISDSLIRGKVDCFINFDDSEDSATEVFVNTGLASSYSEAVSKIAQLTGREDETTASRLAVFPDVLSVRQRDVDEDKLYGELSRALSDALEGMREMRRIEGGNLCSDLLGKVEELSKLRDEVAQRAPSVVTDYKARLSARIDEILDEDKRAFYDENRLAAEVAVFADKCAVDEELKRLLSHFGQARKNLSVDGPVGKKMDFLIQEINREINTIGSKANDLEITNRVLLMKNIVEEMREQIQNLV
ncbi:MAG: YicC family protein [Clostridiales bacterium]|nr:YicC family protein [Clostridiales bacterium]